MSKEPTVFLVDDDQAIRDSLRFLMKSVGLNIECFANAQDFLEAYQGERPGCLILDVRIPGMSGMELMERLWRKGCKLPVIIISGHADVALAVRAMKGGAIDVLEKPFKDQVLLDRIHDAFERNERVLRAEAEKSKILARLDLLTPREREVLDLLVEGTPTKETAMKLGISPKTLSIHRTHILEKMDVKTVTDLVRLIFSIRQ